MIEIYTGAVGSGKSLDTLNLIVGHLHNRHKKFIVANFPIRFTKKEEKKKIDDNFLFLDNDELTPNKLIEYSFRKGFVGKEGYCQLVIDEAGIVFNSRDWQTKGLERKEWIKFFSQSRKFGYHIILVAQDEKMIDKQIRSLAEYEVKHVKMNNYFWFKWLPFPIFARVRKWKGGSFKGEVSFFLYKRWIAKRYNTMKLFDYKDIPEEYQKLAENL